MSRRTVIAAVDGSAESRAAAQWAAREALLRGLPLHLVHAWQDWSRGFAHAPFTGTDTAPGDTAVTRHWAERVPRDVADRLREDHPGLQLSVEQVFGRPVDVLLSAAGKAEMLVLGSRGLGALGGFLTGSVSMPVIAHAERPVVLVRAGERAEDEMRTGDGAARPAQYRDVVLGLDLTRPCDEVIEYAFATAAARGAALRVVHGRDAPLVYGYDPAAVDPGHVVARGLREASALTDALRPWRGKFPQVDVKEQCVVGRAADHLVDASKDASLLVVGRRVRRAAIGTHLGPVTHAVLHHAAAPVAVVPHL
ncbi:universal stress protein [Streptomyces sp. R302]|uniref:universal stress protein n=1 Tax=unclassified Streptomyces TaxID=2593676 RepID=UPI00145F0A19|nr:MULTISPECIES: universal stress protein [unclassified Streptomyces]NML54124.1 universal stress protein [Streptomyces sp. R301]NML83384.1 universal stress protein [Streptomyces sp. R302]